MQKNYSKKKFYDVSPKSIEDGTLPNSFLEKAKGSLFLALERVKGVSFIIVIDDGNIKVHSKEKTGEIVDYINNSLIRPIAKLIQYFNKVNMSIYGEYITHEDSIVRYIGPPKIYFYDMFINDNWIRNDDFIELFNKFKIPTAPVIHNGIMNQDFINKIYNITNSKKSLINGFEDVYGVYIKSLNGIGEHRGISKGAYFYNNKKYIKPERVNKPNDDIANKIRELAYYTITDETITRWEVILKARKISKNKNNLNKIMPVLVADYIKEYEEDKKILALEENISENDAERFIKKYIPKIIIEKLF
ncbi:MAG: RNA ligase family protein [bacterium]